MAGTFIPAPRTTVTIGAASALETLDEIEIYFAQGRYTPEYYETRIQRWERVLRGHGGVPLASLVRDGVDRV